jgi:hypothetical protein
MQTTIEQRKPGRISSALSVFERNIDKNREVAAAAAVATAPTRSTRTKRFFSSFGRIKSADVSFSESFQQDSKSSLSPTSTKKEDTSKVNEYSAIGDDDSSIELASVLDLSCSVQNMYERSRTETKKDIDSSNRKVTYNGDDSVRSERSMSSLKSSRSIKSVSNRQRSELDACDHSISSIKSSRRHFSVTFDLLDSKESPTKDADGDEQVTPRRLSIRSPKSSYRRSGRNFNLQKDLRKDNVEVMMEDVNGIKEKKIKNQVGKITFRDKSWQRIRR